VQLKVVQDKYKKFHLCLSFKLLTNNKQGSSSSHPESQFSEMTVWDLKNDEPYLCNSKDWIM
jgi:hypothetical protein